MSQNDPEGEFNLIDFRWKMPVCMPEPSEIAIQMRINADIIMKEVSDHVDAEVKRFRESIEDHKKL